MNKSSLLTKETAKPSTTTSRGVKILFAVLIAWGLLVAIGSFQIRASKDEVKKLKAESTSVYEETDFRRPLIVGLTMGTFLSVWALALKMKSAKEN